MADESLTKQQAAAMYRAVGAVQANVHPFDASLRPALGDLTALCKANPRRRLGAGLKLSANADFHAANSASWLGELEAEPAALPPGDGGVCAEVGVAQDR
jgi:hypothetical protein